MLPSQRTLRDYTHFAKAISGFSCDVDKQLIDAAGISSCPDWKKHVVLIIGEMHIREDLVYDKFSGRWIYIHVQCTCTSMNVLLWLSQVL